MKDGFGAPIIELCKSWRAIRWWRRLGGAGRAGDDRQGWGQAGPVALPRVLLLNARRSLATHRYWGNEGKGEVEL